ncbi:DUF2256 domain-containing protein [Acinetobacter seifertii]|uniref:DUF2256 domain-containing protein n=1 Tax=Acinetobacter seifertii TaxID=1530123 RepID=UPI0027E41323|nr:DUF2256 domain-containing protein [Acinetobacter seifertii]
MQSYLFINLMSFKIMKKQHLPQKICVYCKRPFDWRKKWERCWEEVKYCSERCKRQARSNK